MFDSWIFWAILWIVSQLVFLQTFKAASRNTTGAGNLIVAVQIIGGVAMLALSPLFSWSWPTSGGEWWLWILFGASFILFAISDRISASTRKNLDISTDSMLHQSYRLIMFPLALITLVWFKFSWSVLVGAFVIVLANMFLLYEKGKLKFNKWVWLKLIGCVVFAVAIVMQMRAVDGFNIGFFAFLSAIVPAIILLLSHQTTPRAVVKEMARPKWWLIVICGLAFGLEILLFSGINASTFFSRNDYGAQANAFFGVYVLLNVIFAYIFLKERSHPIKKSIIAAVIVGCLIVIALKPF